MQILDVFSRQMLNKELFKFGMRNSFLNWYYYYYFSSYYFYDIKFVNPTTTAWWCYITRILNPSSIFIYLLFLGKKLFLLSITIFPVTRKLNVDIRVSVPIVLLSIYSTRYRGLVTGPLHLLIKRWPSMIKASAQNATRLSWKGAYRGCVTATNMPKS